MYSYRKNPCSFLLWGHWMSEVTELAITNSITCTHLLELFTDCWVTHHFEGNWLLEQFLFLRNNVTSIYTEGQETLKHNKKVFHMNLIMSYMLYKRVFWHRLLFKVSVFFYSSSLVTSLNVPEWLYSDQYKALREEVYTWQKHYTIGWFQPKIKILPLFT